MKTTTATYANNKLIPKDLYDQVVQTISHVALLAYTDGFSEGLTKKQQRAINKAWRALTEIVESVVTDEDSLF